MADIEDEGTVSVGGWAHALEQAEGAEGRLRVTRSAFSRLVQLARRAKNLSVEALSTRAHVALEDLVRIEQGEDCTPTPRTVQRLADCLELPPTELMALAGLLEPKDSEFEEAALKFAARSAPMGQLTREERKALEDYVRYLSQRDKPVP